MKTLARSVCLMICFFSSVYVEASSQDSCSSESHKEDAHQKISIVTASELKNMLEKNPAIIVIDARTAQWDNKERIGNAISIPCDSDDTTILTMLPNKDACIAIYCGNLKCPQGKILADRLAALGYIDVYDCAEGLQGWKSMGYSVTKEE